MRRAVIAVAIGALLSLSLSGPAVRQEQETFRPTYEGAPELTGYVSESGILVLDVQPTHVVDSPK